MTADSALIPAGKIQNYKANWERITSNHRILSTVQQEIKLPQKRHIRQFNLDRSPQSRELQNKLEEAIQEYLQRGVISETTNPE